MKKNSSGKRGPAEPGQQNPAPDKTGWIRKFCGKGIFREIWKNRYVVLRGDQLFICEKEVKELGRADEVLDLSDYERCEEIRKNKSRSKKNHSKFRLQRCSSPGNTVTNQVFLALSPEEKDSWINVLNTAITRTKNRILDEVTVDDSQLSHLTRDRVKIPHGRRLPTRGHLLAVASSSSSDGMLTLDLIQEEESASHNGVASEPARSGPVRTAETAVWEKAGPAQTPQPDETLDPDAENQTPTGPGRTAAPLVRLQELIDQKLQRTERLLLEVRAAAEPGGAKGPRAEAERLLGEAAAAWTQSRQVLDEVRELKALCRQLEPGGPNRRSLM